MCRGYYPDTTPPMYSSFRHQCIPPRQCIDTLASNALGMGPRHSNLRPLINHHSRSTHKSTPMLAHDCARTCNLLSLGNHNTIKEEAFVPVLRCGEGGSGRATKPATRTLCRARDVSASGSSRCVVDIIPIPRRSNRWRGRAAGTTRKRGCRTITAFLKDFVLRTGRTGYYHMINYDMILWRSPPALDLSPSTGRTRPGSLDNARDLPPRRYSITLVGGETCRRPASPPPRQLQKNYT